MAAATANRINVEGSGMLTLPGPPTKAEAEVPPSTVIEKSDLGALIEQNAKPVL